ncbi:MAG TPA: peptidoglycan-binding domain-containing protein [Candidatus Obscuribacterales bacterium]
MNRTQTVTAEPGPQPGPNPSGPPVADFDPANLANNLEAGNYSVFAETKGPVKFNTTDAKGQVRAAITDRINHLSPDEAGKILSRMLDQNQEQANPGMLALLLARSKGYHVDDMKYDPAAKLVSFKTQENPDVSINLALGPPPQLFTSNPAEGSSGSQSEAPGTIRDVFAGGAKGDGALGALLDQIGQAPDSPASADEAGPGSPPVVEENEEQLDHGETPTPSAGQNPEPATGDAGPAQTPTVDEILHQGGVLTLDQSGPAVATLKQRLNELGYQLPRVAFAGPNQNKLGATTLEKVKEFQRDYGISPADGKVDKKTWEKLNQVLCEARTLRQQWAQAGNQVGGGRAPHHGCFHGVFEASRKIYTKAQIDADIFPDSHAAAAYMAKVPLSKSPHFKEVKVTPEMLKDPEFLKSLSGAVVVYQRGCFGFDPDAGHIEIWSPDAKNPRTGKAYFDGESDLSHRLQQLSRFPSLAGMSVFLPVPPKAGQ